MLKAGCLMLMLSASLVLQAQKPGGDSSFAKIRGDSLANIRVFKKWLDDVITLSAKDSSQALQLLTEASARAKQEKDTAREGLIQRAGGQIYRNHRVFHRSFAWYLRSYDLLAAVGEPYEIVTAGLELARAQYFRGNYRQAMQHYSHAVEVAAANKISDKEIDATEILGLLYNAFQNFTDGAATFKKALDIKYQLNDQRGILYTLEILSTIYYRNKQFDSSLMYASQALQLAQQYSKSSNMELSRLNKAAALVRLNRLPEAGEEIKELQKLDVNGTNVNLMVRYNVLMGNFYLAKRADSLARHHYDVALRRAALNQFPELYAVVYNNMADSYYERGDFKTAYQYARKYTEIASDLYTGENVISLGNLETILKTDRSADEIRYLNNENKLNQLELLRESELRAALEKENILQDSIRKALSRENESKVRELQAEKKLREVLSEDNIKQEDRLQSERNMSLLLLVTITAMLVLGVIIFYLYRKQRRKNAIILKQSDDMQVLMKEIHHRVKNNLQVISSLLDLQALSIKHDQAAEAVKEGRNRVQSMALIHQNLYNEGNIKGIKVKTYIDTLAQGLFHSYNIKARSVHLTTDIDDLNLDVDTVIPIGLILNELITNSLKYAFRDKEYGEISVMLKKDGDNLVLKVRDNGDGFPPDSSMQPETTFGIKLIKAFAQKLKARLSIYNDNGACVEMHIARYKIAEQTPVRELV
jgi:two-component system, sensor histidine kinase PdtaS